MGGLALGGLFIRVAYILLVENPYHPAADALYYESGAQALVDGEGFINGISWGFTKGRLKLPSAFHPPAYTVFLALPKWLGFDTVLDHQMATALLGTATIVVVALLARRLGGSRAGLIAGGVAAIYPNLWFSDVFLMSESLSVLTTAGAVLIAYRCISRPGLGVMAALGLICGIGALARAESVFLAPLLATATAVLVRDASWRRRLALVGVPIGAMVAVIAPWVSYNMSRFERPVYLSNGFGNLLDTSNCAETYYGDRLGSYSGLCQPGNLNPEESQYEHNERQRAIRYMTNHAHRLPIVALARVGRTWGLYRPIQVIQLDHEEPQEPRELPTAYIALAMYYALCLFAVSGAIVVHRRRHASLLLVMMPILMVTLVAVATNGQTRYRASAETSIVVLASIGIGRQRRRTTRAGPGLPAPAPGGDPVSSRRKRARPRSGRARTQWARRIAD